jgi:hypothetical protein
MGRDGGVVCLTVPAGSLVQVEFGAACDVPTWSRTTSSATVAAPIQRHEPLRAAALRTRSDRSFMVPPCVPRCPARCQRVSTVSHVTQRYATEHEWRSGPIGWTATHVEKARSVPPRHAPDNVCTRQHKEASMCGPLDLGARSNSVQAEQLEYHDDDHDGADDVEDRVHDRCLLRALSTKQEACHGGWSGEHAGRSGTATGSRLAQRCPDGVDTRLGAWAGSGMKDPTTEEDTRGRNVIARRRRPPSGNLARPNTVLPSHSEPADSRLNRAYASVQQMAQTKPSRYIGRGLRICNLT